MSEHTKDGGKIPQKYALTELVKECIISKDYKIYFGGGYEYGTKNAINKYDVVCYINMTGDPFFMVCMDNEDGDFCTLFCCNSDCEFEKIEI